MGKFLKFVFSLALIAFLALAGYAFLGDLSPAHSPVTLPITLDVE